MLMQNCLAYLLILQQLRLILCTKLDDKHADDNYENSRVTRGSTIQEGKDYVFQKTMDTVHLYYLEPIMIAENPSLFSEKCFEDLMYMQDTQSTNHSSYSTTNYWQKQMINSYARPPSGVFEINIYWMGDPIQCTSVEVWKQSNQSLHKEPDFRGKHCLSLYNNFENLIPNHPLSTGLCIPSTCNITEANNIAREYAQPLNFQFTEEMCITSETKKMDSTTKMLLIPIAILVALVIMGTTYDIVQNKRSKEDKVAIENGTVTRKILIAFSATRNTKKLLNTDEKSKKDGVLDCIDGIRAITMMTIVVGHVYLMFNTELFWKNVMQTIYNTDNFFYTLVYSTEFSVDTFLSLSGFLLVYIFLRTVQKTNGKFNVLEFYIHRISRILPTYALIVAIMSGPYIQLADGIIWRSGKYYDYNYCRKNWWKHLMYIQTYYWEDNKCLPQTWYLCLDMFYYFVSPIFLYPLFKKPVVGISMCVTCFIGAVTWLAALIHNNDLIPVFTIYADPEKRQEYSFSVYYTPWGRMHAFLAGMLFGYWYYKKGNNIAMHKVVVAITWFVVAAAMITIVVYPNDYVGEKKKFTKAQLTIYGSLSRPLWALCIGWVVFACATGYGGVINTILSWKGFLPISRLSYLAYLVHIPVIVHFFLSRNETIYIELFFANYICVAMFVITMIVSWAIHILIEAPFVGLEQVFLRR